MLLGLFGTALLIRLVLIPQPGFKADIAFWKWWGKAGVEEGITQAISHTNYPPIYLYILKATSWTYRLFAPLSDNSSYWDAYNYLYLLLIKLPYIAADLGIGWLIYLIIKNLATSSHEDITKETSSWATFLKKFTQSSVDNLIKKDGSPENDEYVDSAEGLRHSSQTKSATIGSEKSVAKRLSIFAASLFLLNPAVIYNSAIWGQTDSLSSFFILLMFYFLLSGRYYLFGALTTFNIFLKVQSLPFIGLGLILIARKEGLDKAIKSLIPAVLVMALVNLPFILTNSFSSPVNVMTNSFGYFPYASLNAYNLHWLLIGGVSDKYPDSTKVIGSLSHKALGDILFATAVILIIASLWKRPDTHHLFFLSLLAIFSSYMFMTEIHERYLFPLYMFGAVLVASSALTTSRLRFNLKTYLLLSLGGLINLHLVMIQNYPENNLSFLNFLLPARIPISLGISVVNFLVFVYISYSLMRSASLNPKKFTRNRAFWPSIGTIVTIFIAAKLFHHQPNIVPLTSLHPIFSTQQWGSLTKNLSVGGNLLAPAYYYHRHGLGTHAGSKIEYDLGGKYSRFTTSFGTDIESPDSGSTQFVILLDDKPVWQSDIMRKWTKPGYTEIKVAGVKKLTLVVTDAGDGINGDHADWLEPTLYI